MNRWFLFIALLAPLPEPLLAGVDVKIEPTPDPYTWQIVTAGNVPEYAGMQVLLTWDAGEILATWAENPDNWWAAGFIPDGLGINDSIADGNAIWVGFGAWGNLPQCPGTVCYITFSESCCVELGKSIGVAQTIVTTTQGQDITGELVGGCWE